MDQKFENVDCLKSYIDTNYKESSLIDYDTIQRNNCRNENSRFMSQGDLNREFSNESARVWKFIADRCNILGAQ